MEYNEFTFDEPGAIKLAECPNPIRTSARRVVDLGSKVEDEAEFSVVVRHPRFWYHAVCRVGEP